MRKKVLKDFKYKNFIDNISIDCGRDLKVFCDILFYFPGAWDKDENKRKDLCYLGISLWGNEYRYYAGLHKTQCGITSPKEGRLDKKNKTAGYKYLNENYNWFFNGATDETWNGYSYESEMYLYKKTDISDFSIKELSEKVHKDLSKIHEYIKK